MLIYLRREQRNENAFFSNTSTSTPPNQIQKSTLSPPRGALCVLPKSVSLLLLTIYKKKIHRAYRSLPNSRFFALTFQKKCCRPSSWPRRIAALVTKTARRVADPMRELGSRHAEVRAPAPAKFL